MSEPAHFHLQLLDRLRRQSAELLDRFPVEGMVRELDLIHTRLPYNEFSEGARSIWEGVRTHSGDTGLGRFNQLLLLTLMADFEARRSTAALSPLSYTARVEACFERSFERIAKTIDESPDDAYAGLDDILFKDLALCRQKMFPAGAQLVEADTAFHRALAFRAGIGQFLRFAALLLQAGGNKGYFQYHTHLSDLSEFNPDGWEAFYETLAGMLEANPDARGGWGGSWFFDPALESISPRLAYLRTLPMSGGARMFYSGPNPNSGALARSETRNRLYREGKYVPTEYCIIWPAKDLIAWGKRRAAA